MMAGLRLRGLSPISRPSARLLILGSMPGAASLAAQEYYAQPRNAFWTIIESALGIPKAMPYRKRIAELRRHDIAVWDVLASCHRPGSLDGDIDLATAVPNDFAAFFARHRRIQRICFNGQTAARLFVRLVEPTLDGRAAELERVVLPSTSPAHAGMPVARKIQSWASGLKPLPKKNRG
jgi:hypoxanthine-DNA glycosylase